MRYYQLGGFREIRNRWDKVFISRSGRNDHDQKGIAGKVYKALTVPISGSKVIKGEVETHHSGGEEIMEEEITLTLGILPSGASVLLLTPTQLDQIYSYWRFHYPPPLSEVHSSSSFESLSPIEFGDIDSLAAKLRSLTPNSKRRSNVDTSRDNRGFQLSDMKKGSERGLFEHTRLLRQLAMERISSPPPPSHHLGENQMHHPYAQFSVPHNFKEVILPRIQVAAFAFTSWAADRRDTVERYRSPDLLDVAWARAEGGMRNLRASSDSDTGGQQVDFGWNAFKSQQGMTKKTFPRSRVQAQRDPDLGIWLFEKLLGPQVLRSSSVSSSMLNEGSANSALNTEHLILLVFDEPATRAIFLDHGVDLLSGEYNINSNSSSGNGDESGPYRWKWINRPDAGLKKLLRDDSYGNLDFTRNVENTRHRPSSNSYNSRYNNNNNRYPPRRSPSSSASSLYTSHSLTPFSSSSPATSSTSQDRNSHHLHDDRGRYSPPPSHASGSHSNYYDRSRKEDGKHGLELKQELWDDEHRLLKRPKREPREPRLRRGDRFDQDGDDTTSEEEEEVVESKLNERTFMKNEEYDTRIKDESRGFVPTNTRRASSPSSDFTQEPRQSKQQPSHSQSQPPILEIHVLDLKALFHTSTGSQTGAASVQTMAQELQLGGGGVILNGKLGEEEYGSGWDAELLLSIFQSFTDGRTIDEQKATASSRYDVARDEEKERIKQREAERDRRRSSQPGVDSDVDPSDIRASDVGKAPSWLDGYSDYGESD
ncbi:hypothetical protein J3R30DRAFT_3432133 [Lentinula aciculospora]|uniref:Uncharacterized protein n=1 Tax=Lentinula aciculospora TaxID=153920 RepID=A0A9W9DWU2_9AGAR|nr:hypothetical protein J3R30DRAFT_3432133 [Lentinula aciculospora]